MTRFFSTLILSFLFLTSFSQASNTYAVRLADTLMLRYTPTINNMTGKGWEYSNTIITHGMEKVYDQVPTASYLNYIKAYIDLYVNSSGAISQAMTSLDKIHPGISCLFLYEKLKSNPSDSTKYRNAATNIRNVLVGPSSTYSKTANGIFWHKLSGYNNIVMLDGMYMAHPFLAKYGRLFNDNAAIDTAVNQVLFCYNQLYDNTTHLIKHAWTSTPGSYTWANGTTGNSSEVWSRAMGWYVMAIVDILKYIPVSHPKRSNLLTALSNLAIGIQNYQDATTGLWYQVVDKGIGHTGYTSANYIETSGSAMFIYAIKTAVDSGWISSSYLPVAQNGWNGLKTYITTYGGTLAGGGGPRVTQFAPAMSVQNNYAAYVGITAVSVPTPNSGAPSGTQNPHGYAAVLMAASVMEFPMITLPVKFNDFAVKIFTDKNHLSWKNGDETGVDFYNIEKSLNGTDFSVIGKKQADGSSEYSFDDFSISGKTVYYRINAVYLNQASHYSTILPVRRNNRTVDLKISPNPITDNTVNLVIPYLPTGKYSISIYDMNGTLITIRQLSPDNEGGSVQSIQLPKTISAGTYHVCLDGNGIKITKTIMVK